jgi:hypothetical protein
VSSSWEDVLRLGVGSLINKITSHTTKVFEQSTAYNGVLVYNKLLSEIKSVKSIIKFKKIFRNFLLEKSFYSVEEFMTVDSSFVGTGLKMYLCMVIASAFFCVLC